MRLITALLLSTGAWHAAIANPDGGSAVISKVRNPKPDSGYRPAIPEWAKGDPYAPNMPKTAYTSMTRPDASYRIYHNLWWHNSKWYALLPADNADDPSLEDGLSPNNAVVRLPVTDMYNFTKQLRVRRFRSSMRMPSSMPMRPCNIISGEKGGSMHAYLRPATGEILSAHVIPCDVDPPHIWNLMLTLPPIPPTLRSLTSPGTLP